jgi:hypothetical protein
MFLGTLALLPILFRLLLNYRMKLGFLFGVSLQHRAGHSGIFGIKLQLKKSFPNQPADWVFKTLIFLQQWWPLLRSKDNIDVEIMEELLRKLYQDTNSPPAA